MIIDGKLMKYVVFKKRTEYEVRRKCKVLNYSDDYIEEVIEYLKEANYINDKLYVEKYIRDVKLLKKLSIAEIKYDLMKRGIREDMLTEDLNEFELFSAIELVKKKIKTEEIEKIKKYLLNKGYKSDNITRAIDIATNIIDN